MLSSPKSPSSSATSSAAPPPPLPQGNSAEDTLISSSGSSALATIVNFSRKYALALQTNSFREMWSKIHPTGPIHQVEPEQVLHPNRECVEVALRHAKSNTLTDVAKPFFHHSENATDRCLCLQQRVSCSRTLYAFIDVLRLDSDSQYECNRAFDLFLEFDRPENPFSGSDSYSFDDMHSCFCHLKQDLDRRHRKSVSRTRLLRCWGCSHSHSKEAAHMAQLVDVYKSTVALNEELNTVNSLVRRLFVAVDSDKTLIRMALERGRSEKHFIMDVVKDLRKNHPNLLRLLQELEERICICFKSINKARDLLLQEIRLHHTLVSRDHRYRQGAQSAASSRENFVYSPG